MKKTQQYEQYTKKVSLYIYYNIYNNINKYILKKQEVSILDKKYKIYNIPNNTYNKTRGINTTSKDIYNNIHNKDIYNIYNNKNINRHVLAIIYKENKMAVEKFRKTRNCLTMDEHMTIIDLLLSDVSGNPDILKAEIVNGHIIDDIKRKYTHKLDRANWELKYEKERHR